MVMGSVTAFAAEKGTKPVISVEKISRDDYLKNYAESS